MSAPSHGHNSGVRKMLRRGETSDPGVALKSGLCSAVPPLADLQVHWEIWDRGTYSAHPQVRSRMAPSLCLYQVGPWAVVTMAMRPAEAEKAETAPGNFHSLRKENDGD